MSRSPSFTKTNYSVRPNKNVERKLMTQCFAALQDSFGIQDYRYVGFGSMWFVDYALFHRVLGIADMVSIEEASMFIGRANFNKPFGCITVVEGESTVVLPDVGLSDKRTLVWLDYDTDLRGPVHDDLAIVCREVVSGSIVAVTLNAHPNQLVAEGEDGLRRDKAEVLAELIRVSAAGINESDTTRRGLGRFMGKELIKRIQSLVQRASGSIMHFVPLFTFTYTDGAPMVTLAGMVVNDADQIALENLALGKRFDFVRGAESFDIDVPVLTYKEKLAIDQLFPCDQAPTSEEVEALGFFLEQEHVTAYHRFYQVYPNFIEAIG